MTNDWKIAVSEQGVTQLSLRRSSANPERGFDENNRRSKDSLARAKKELRDYFTGRVRSVTVRYDISRMSAFTQAVLKEAAKIPYGQVRTYQWLAARLGKPKAGRAVGNALARNPLPIIIPCHRVVRADGSIGRFALGSGWKKRLLELEESFAKTKASSANAG